MSVLDHYDQTLETKMMFIPEIVDWAFSKKQRNLLHITEHFGENRGDLFTLFEVLYLVEQLKTNNCPNIQDKFANTTDWGKLCSLSSELLFAHELTKLGFLVSLIPDKTAEWTIKKGKKEQDTPSPDISAVKNGQEFLIEVAGISGDETTSEIGDSIGSLARKSHFRVEIQYSEKLSIPVVSYNERKEREQLIEEFIDEFKKIIKTVDSSTLPQERDIYGCKVTFTKPLSGKRGYYAGCVTGAVIIPKEKFEQEIAYRVEQKAKKRANWDKCQKNKPYLIALDIQQDFIFSWSLISLFFGGRCYFEPPLEPRYSELLIVSEAKARGWQKLLEEVGFSNQTHSPVTEPGLFITNPCVSQNITGVIARIRGELYCLPNPFAEESINLLDLHKEISWPLPQFPDT